MRVRTVSAGVLLAALAACTYTTQRDELSPQEEPLEVSLLPDLQAVTTVPSLSFVLNRPAYVAAFEVIPGRGMQLLYPAGSADESNAGLNIVTEAPFFYADYLLPPFVAPAAQPHYIYIVASDTPLDLGTLKEPAGLLNKFGIERFASATPSYFMDQVTSQVIQPGTSDDAWSSDMMMDWSGTGGVDLQLATTQLRCKDGSLIIVPLSYGSALCPGDALRARPVLASYTAPSNAKPSKNPRKPSTNGTGQTLAVQRAAHRGATRGSDAPQVRGGFLGRQLAHSPDNRTTPTPRPQSTPQQQASEPRPEPSSAPTHAAPPPAAPAPLPAPAPAPQKIHP